MPFDIDDWKIETFRDVHTAFAAQTLVLKKDVAAERGLSPDRFSLEIRDREGRPSDAWIAGFRTAWKAVERRKREEV